MKWFSIFLAFNILVATNGIALCDHFCSIQEVSKTENCCDGSGLQDCSTSDDSEDCCQVTFTDFLKQDLLVYNTAAFEVEELHAIIQFALINYQTVLFSTSDTEVNTNHYPLPTPIKSSDHRSLLQVFRC